MSICTIRYQHKSAHDVGVFFLIVEYNSYRVSRDVTAALGVLRVASAEVALDVEHGAGAAGRDDGGDQIEGVAVGIVSACEGKEEEQWSVY